MRKQMSDSAQGQELSPYQLHALFLLSGRPCTMHELAEELSVALPTATALVNRLVNSGWVERGLDPSDRRVVRLAITSEGSKVLAKAKEHRYRKMKFLLDAMPEEDVNALHRILSNAYAELEARTKGETIAHKSVKT